MQKIYFIFLAILAINMRTSAQCSGCTINITGLDAAPHIVTAGQVFCISPTGTVTGQITVSTGGTLCNQGTINSFNLWIAGGTLKNYGTITTNNVLVSTAGTYTNYATTIIDSLLVQNPSSTYINNGTQTSDAFGIADYGIVENNGSISAILMADSIGTVTNNGIISITGIGLSNAYSSNFTNNGNLTVDVDFANSYSSNFTNNNYMNIGRDWYNSTNANFTTKCMMTVGRDWYNSSNVYGPTVSCGGFNIIGVSLSTGLVGSANTHLDLCDAGNPALGIDGPGGTIINTTTYCNCANTCAVVTEINEVRTQSQVSIGTIYPNPTSYTLHIKLNTRENETLMVEVKDTVGRIVIIKTYHASIGENETEINISDLAQGTYILSITDSNQLQTNRLFSVAK
jgi:hypothetical protein